MGNALSHELSGGKTWGTMFIVVVGAGSRVVKSLDCGARGPGFENR